MCIKYVVYYWETTVLTNIQMQTVLQKSTKLKSGTDIPTNIQMRPDCPAQ